MLKICKFMFICSTFVFALMFVLPTPSTFAVDSREQAIDASLAQPQKAQATQDAAQMEQAKQLEKKVKSFKRFEVAYESMWLTGEVRENHQITKFVFFGEHYGPARIKYPLNTRMDIFKGKFYIFPRTFIEGAYGMSHLEEDKQGKISLYLEDVLTGGSSPLNILDGRLRTWNADLNQNIFTLSRTGIKADIFAGYKYYTERTRLEADTFFGSFGFKHTYQGGRFGARLIVPVNVPKYMSEEPLNFLLSCAYAPYLSMKNHELTTSSSYKSHGDMIEASLGVSFKIWSGFYFEGRYNYLRFKQKHGKGGLSNPNLTTNFQEATTAVYGPSASVKYVF